MIRDEPPNTMTFYIAPVDDPQALANKLTFGHVDRVDPTQRRITMTYSE